MPFVSKDFQKATYKRNRFKIQKKIKIVSLKMLQHTKNKNIMYRDAVR